jgi:hypothetical protein
MFAEAPERSTGVSGASQGVRSARGMSGAINLTTEDVAVSLERTLGIARLAEELGDLDAPP